MSQLMNVPNMPNNSSAGEFRRWALNAVLTYPRISEAVQGHVVREFSALKDVPLSGSWNERQERLAQLPYPGRRTFAPRFTRLHAAHYARRFVESDTIAARFLSLVIDGLNSSAEAELDQLYTCFPMLDALADAGHVTPLGPSALATQASTSVCAHDEQAGDVLESAQLYRLALQIGQQCAAWFTPKEELIQSMRMAGQ